jgi:hypothetical protein
MGYNKGKLKGAERFSTLFVSKEWILTWYKATEYSKRGEANAHKSSNASIA